MNNPVTDIKHLHDEVFKLKPECRYDGGPRFLSKEHFKSRLIMLREEIDEYEEAVEKQDLEGVLDALIDLMVFTAGTMYLHGFAGIFEEAWRRVQEANLQKYAGNKGRGTDCDMIKPLGWEAPTFEDLL